MATKTNEQLDLVLNDHGQDTLGVAAWASVNWLRPYDQNHHPDDWLIDDNLHHPAVIQYSHAAEAPLLAGDIAPITTAFGNVQQPWNPLGQAAFPSLIDMHANANPSTSFPQMIVNVPLEQKRHTCLGCKRKDPGSCVRAPYCQLCAECARDTGFDRPPSRIAESPFLFLNYELWFATCQELGRQLRGPRPPRTSVHLPDDNCCKFILELDFEDLRVRRDIANTYMVVCDLHFDTQTNNGRRLDAFVQAPCPRINMEMFDEFVLTAMWRPLCAQRRPKDKFPSPPATAKGPATVKGPATAKGHTMTKDPTTAKRLAKAKRPAKVKDPSKAEDPVEKLSKIEAELFTKAQLIVGYYSLLGNLNSICTDETALPAVDGRFMLAEMTYLFVYRISVLIVEFSRMCPSLDDIQFQHDSRLPNADLTPRIRPGYLLYALEILFLGIKSAGLPSWKLGKIPSSDPLRRLEREAKEAYHFLLKNVRAYECRIAGLYGNQHNLGLPGLVELVRLAKAGLPKHLVVTMQRYVPPNEAPDPLASFKLFPCLHVGQGFLSIIEILAVRSGEVALAVFEETWISHQHFPEDWIHEDNSRSKCDLANVEYKERSDNACTDVSIGYPHTATKQGLGLLDQHPDPPTSFDVESLVVALAGLHPDDNDEHGVPNDVRSNGSWGTAITALANLLVPEQWKTDFCDSQGQRRPEFKEWSFRPTGVFVPRRKRKHGDDGFDGDSGSESTSASKRREIVRSFHPELMAFCVRGHGREILLRYLKVSPSP